MTARFLLSAGEGVGLGHLSRCRGLGDALRLWGITSRLQVRGLIGRDVAGDSCDFTDWLGALRSDSEAWIADLHRASLIVADSYELAPRDVDRLGELFGFGRIAFFDDGQDTHQFPDESIRIRPATDFQGSSSARELLGPAFYCLRKQFWGANWTPPETRTVHVSLGGAPSADLIEAVSAAITAVGARPRLVIDDGAAAPGSWVSVVRNADPDTIVSMLQSSDMAVVSGGQSLVEAIAIGVPAFAIQTAGNQATNIDLCRPQVTARSDDPELKSLIGTFVTRAPHRTEKTVSAIGSVNAANSIAALISGSELRLASEADMERVFALSNDPIVRSVSINRSEIPWDQHVQWFRQRVMQHESPFYVCVDLLESDRPLIAQVRFERVDAMSAEVSISVAAKYRGKGFGVRMLRITQILASHDFGISSFIAMIRPSNMASVRLFESLGYSTIDRNPEFVRMQVNGGINV